LSSLLLASVASAAPGLKPGGFAEFRVELPKELRLVAGRGQLSPVANAMVTIAAPPNLDKAHDWPVLVISATSDPQYNSSRSLMSAYADTALGAGWILVAADPVEPVTVEQDDVALRLALNVAALKVLELQWPAAGKAPLAFGGFSGGAKYSGWLAAAFAQQGRAVAGIYLAGINADAVISAAQHFQVLDAKFKRVPIFLQSGDGDTISTPTDHLNIYDQLKGAGFKNVRVENFPGAHVVEPGPLRKALDWFREFATLPIPVQ
jgi:predicted esterase